MAKKNNYNTNCFILSQDKPTEEVDIKKQLLFFDKVVMPHPADMGLMNDGEICEQFNCGKIAGTNKKNILNISHASRLVFPRTEDYDDKIWGLYNNINKTNFLKNKINFIYSGGNDHNVLKREDLKQVFTTNKVTNKNALLNAKSNLNLHNVLASNENFVRAALPDVGSVNIDSIRINPGILSGFWPSPTGLKSSFSDIKNKPFFKLEELGNKENFLAYSRLARFVKNMQYVYQTNSHPIILDNPNYNIYKTIDSELFTNQLNISQSSQKKYKDLSSLAISTDLFDEDSLRDNLSDMNWEDVIEFRKGILPKIQDLKYFLILKIKEQLIGLQNSPDIDSFTDEITKLKKDFKEKKEIASGLFYKLVQEMGLSSLKFCKDLKNPKTAISLCCGTSIFGGVLAGLFVLGSIAEDVRKPIIKHWTAQRNYKNHLLAFVSQNGLNLS